MAIWHGILKLGFKKEEKWIGIGAASLQTTSSCHLSLVSSRDAGGDARDGCCCAVFYLFHHLWTVAAAAAAAVANNLSLIAIQSSLKNKMNKYCYKIY